MKKILLIAGLLLIIGLAFSTQTETKKVDAPVEEVVLEDDLLVEDWMTKPFITLS